jgi:hypothetical protein
MEGTTDYSFNLVRTHPETSAGATGFQRLNSDTLGLGLHAKVCKGWIATYNQAPGLACVRCSQPLLIHNGPT